MEQLKWFGQWAVKAVLFVVGAAAYFAFVHWLSKDVPPWMLIR